MSNTFQQWVGQVVDGKFPLLRYLGGSGRSAVFLTERREGDSDVKVAIKLIPSLPDSDELQLARWRLAVDLCHPHLISIFEMGRCEMGETALLYVVMECAEENLAEVLGSRPLTPQETREMLVPVLQSLAYLHDRGLVHGHLRPGTIMADNDQLKLSSDGLCPAGESNGLSRTPNVYDPPENARGIIPMTGVASTEGDVWSLGIALVEALTQHTPASPTSGLGEVSLPQDLPEPFFDIARHCLVHHPAGRWTVAQIAERLEGRVPVAPVRPVAAEVRRPVRPQRVTPRPQRRTRPPGGRRSYVLPTIVAVGVLAIVMGPKLFRRAPANPGLTANASEQAAAQGQPKQPLENTTAGIQALGPVVGRGATQKTQEDERAVPLPAAVRSDATEKSEREASGASTAAANLAGNTLAGAIVRGAVKERVLPTVPQNAQDGIRGTVRVSVSLDVDSSGSVENAEITSGGPSKYFAKLALGAAKQWKFQPPIVAGRGAISHWNLRFDFAGSGTTVAAEQDVP